MKQSINELIAEFAETQNRLCRMVIAKYGITDDDSVIFAAPKTGSLELNDEKWTFKRHGLGVRFVSDRSGRIIDAHRNIVSCPAGFDAWRLLQFFGEFEAADLNLAGEVGRLDGESKVNDLLTFLAAQGVIKPVEKIAGLYVEIQKPT